MEATAQKSRLLILIFLMITFPTVRLLRKAFALTQDELAELLAVSQTIVSRVEADEEPPTLETALALQVLFDVEPKLLFNRRYRKVEDAVMQRAAELDRRIAGKTDAASLKKQELLALLVKRAQPANAE